MAHSTGENYVWLNVAGAHIEGRFEIRLGDLERRFGLDLPKDPEGVRQALESSAPRVQDYLRENFAISAGGEEIRDRVRRNGAHGDRRGAG